MSAGKKGGLPKKAPRAWQLARQRLLPVCPRVPSNATRGNEMKRNSTPRPVKAASGSQTDVSIKVREAISASHRVTDAAIALNDLVNEGGSDERLEEALGVLKRNLHCALAACLRGRGPSKRARYPAYLGVIAQPWAKQ